MIEGGKHLAEVKNKLVEAIKAGVTPLEIDSLADTLIAKLGDSSSFKTVSGYHHSTCINVGSVVVHGIPTNIPFKPGDLVTLDVGLVHKSWHLDTSVSLQIEPKTKEISHFLEVGRASLNNALKKATVGQSIFAISLAMQEVVEAAGFSVIRDLTGHGIGHSLHEDPHIPCYGDHSTKSIILKPGQAIAVEIMYTMGKSKLREESDGWTLVTADGSQAAMFEESVFITEDGQIILTR